MKKISKGIILLYVQLILIGPVIQAQDIPVTESVSTDSLTKSESGIFDSPEIEIAPSVDLVKLSKSIKYPEEARKVGIEGRVTVRALIDEYGNVIESYVDTTANVMLNSAALEAVNKADFEPAVFEGKNVKCWMNIPIIFKLEGGRINKLLLSNDLQPEEEIKTIVQGTGEDINNRDKILLETKIFSATGQFIEKRTFTIIAGKRQAPTPLDKYILKVKSGTFCEIWARREQRLGRWDALKDYLVENPAIKIEMEIIKYE
jgi:TonB family protein